MALAARRFVYFDGHSVWRGRNIFGGYFCRGQNGPGKTNPVGKVDKRDRQDKSIGGVRDKEEKDKIIRKAKQYLTSSREERKGQLSRRSVELSQ